MNGVFWLVVLGFAATVCGIVWYTLRKFGERRAAEEARAASFLAATTGKTRMVETTPAPPPVAVPVGALPAGNNLGPQKLLFEAAHKAGEAGEPAIAIQLYARLLARYPSSGFADQARTAVEAQKKKLAKA